MFKISTDHQYDEKIDKPLGLRDLTGMYFHTGRGRAPTQEEIAKFNGEKHVQFKIYDGDGNLYFTGLMTEAQADSEDVFEPLDFARGYAGATTIKLKEGDQWKEV